APAGLEISACTSPPGPVTQASSTATDSGAGSPGGVSTTAPEVERITAGDAARRVDLLQRAGGQVVAVQLVARVVGAGDEQGGGVGVPVGADLTGEVEHDLADLAADRVP